MTKVIELNEIQSHLDELMDSARRGDEIIVEINHQPIYKLVPLAKQQPKRKAGLGRGEGWISEDFDAPLPSNKLSGKRKAGLEQGSEWISKDFNEIFSNESRLGEFVDFWAARYKDKNEPLYVENIIRPLTAEKTKKLFAFKKGFKKYSSLPQKQSRSIETNFISRIEYLNTLPSVTTAEQFLTLFPSGGAIWRIFWLHCWQPERFPIYDQHVHRAMIFIKEGKIQEIPHDDPKKIDLYLNRYIPFSTMFSALEPRKIDQALWTFGKFLKRWSQQLD